MKQDRTVFSFEQAYRLYQDAPEGAYRKALRTILALHGMILSATEEADRAHWLAERDSPRVLSALSHLVADPTPETSDDTSA